MKNKFEIKNFIAEIGVNHENDINKAKLMIDECSDIGIGAVKFQSYSAKKLAAKHSPAYWDVTKESTKSQIELFSKYDLFDQREFNEIANYCEKKDIEFMSTPFDEDYVDVLDPLVNRFKIASVDLTNFILIKKIAQKGKPIVLSTGASTIDEIKHTVQYIKGLGVDIDKDLSLLHCVTKYPNPISTAGLGSIKSLSEIFPSIDIGYSDHTIPEESELALACAITMGAKIIEKHYTFDKNLPGNDHYHSFDKNDLIKFSESLESLNSSLQVANIEDQINSIKFARRGLYLKKSIKAGEKITKDHLIPLRPLLDFISPIHWEDIVGREVNKDKHEGEGIKNKDFS